MSNSRISRTVGKRALAGILSATMVASGVVVVDTVVAPVAFAKEWKNATGQGELLVRETVAKAGDTIHVRASGLKANATYTLKLDDGAVKFEDNQADQLTYFDEGYVQLTTDADGAFRTTLVLPETLASGEHDVRLLGTGVDELPVSQFKTFTVEAADGSNPGTDNPDKDDATNSGVAKVEEISSEYGNSAFELNNDVSFKARGFKPGSKVTGWINGEQVKFTTQWYAPPSDELTVNEKGAVKASFSVPSKFAIAGVEQTIKLKDSEDTSATTTFTIADTPAFIHKPQMPLANAAQGNKNEVVVANLPEDAMITYVGTEEKNFLPSGATFAATGDHTAVATNVAIPTGSDIVGKEVVVKVKVNGEERTVKTGTLVTVSDELSTNSVDIAKSAELPAGLYVPAFSKKHNAVYVTRSFLGIGTSEGPAAQILKVDADTLEVKIAQDAPTAQGFPPAYAAFGIDVDDARDRVWVTNSLQGTVAVYSADDLKLIKQFKPADGEKALQAHAHQPIVDENTGNVYVSGFDERHAILAIDGNTLEPMANPEIPGLEKSVGLDYDAESKNLFAVRFAFAPGTEPAVFRYNLETKKVDKVLLAETDLRATNISFDKKTGQAFVTIQGANEVVVVDFDKGEVVDRIHTDAQPVYLQVDSDSRRVYVGNRTGKTLTVLDADTHKRLDNVDVGTYPNGITLDGKGGAYVVNMKNQIDKTTTDQIFHVVPKVASTPDPKPQGSAPGSSDLGASNGGGSSLSVLAAIIPLVLGIVGLGFLYDWIQKNPLPGMPALPPLPKIGR